MTKNLIRLIDFVNMFRVILSLGVRELHSLFIFSFFCVVVTQEIFFAGSYMISNIPIQGK